MEYKFNDWNFELIQELNLLLNKLKELNLKGRTIKSVNIVGHGYALY